MEVMHKRVAGLDVHKATVVACARLVVGRKLTRECRTFVMTTAGLTMGCAGRGDPPAR
jgi:hypothetical protein